MRNICFLCASDEGIFLEISKDKTFFSKLETCLSLKASKEDALSTKICHKCAYEVDKCSDFVHKYKESRKKLEKNPNKPRKSISCNFCLRAAKTGYIFNLKQTNKHNDALNKIFYLFEDDLSDAANICICLWCRYSLDVLYDLKSISEEVSEKLHKIIEEGIDVALLPKTRTYIVRRKTTHIKNPRLDLHPLSDADRDSDTMARGRNGSGKMSGDKTDKRTKNRFCDECLIETEKGVDMFRIHRTGRTVCKDCWIRMDPDKDTLKNKRKRNSSENLNPRTCKVFLKDILISSNSQELKLYHLNKSEDGKVVYTVTDDSSSGSESRSSTKTKAQLKELPEMSELSKLRQFSKKERKITTKIKEPTRAMSKRIEEKVEVSQNIEKSRSGRKIEKPVEELEKEKPEFEKPTRLKRFKAEKPAEVENSASITRRLKRANSNQNSDSDVSETKRSRSKSVEPAKLTRPARKTKVQGDSESTGYSEDSSQGEDLPKRKRRERSTSILSVASSTSISMTRKGTRGKKLSPISSKETSPAAELKSPPKISKPNVAKRAKGRPGKVQVFERNSFNCAACGTDLSDSEEYRIHQKLHLKDLEIKIQRVVVEDKNVSERLPSVEEKGNTSEKIDVDKGKENEDNIEAGMTDQKDKVEDKPESRTDKAESGSEKPIEKPVEEDSQSQDEDRENLEDLLQREELQVIDEVAESASSAIDPDEEPDKEVVNEKNESNGEESQEDFEVVFTGSSQDSLGDALTLNHKREEAEKCAEDLGESLEKEKSENKEESSEKEPLLEPSLEKEKSENKEESSEKEPLLEPSLEKEKSENKEESSEKEPLLEEALEKESLVQESTEKSLQKDESLDESKESDKTKQTSRHSTPTRDEKNDRNVDDKEPEKAINTNIEDPLEIENPIEKINDFTDNIPDTDDIFEHLPTEIANVVQNGLELENPSEVNQITNQDQIEPEIQDPLENKSEDMHAITNENTNEIEKEITKETESLRTENEENKTTETVGEVLTDVCNLATTVVEEETVKATSYLPSQDLEEISNDGLNGSDMPTSETADSNL